MPLAVNTFSQYVSNFATTLANNTAKITNLRSGSVAYAIARAVGGNAIALQRLIVNVYAVCRLATSTGSDVDSFVNDYGLLRLQATTATGALTLTRATSGVELTIPAEGGIVQTSINGVQFQATPDGAQSSYDAVRNVYVFTPSETVITITVAALIPGSTGNIAQGSLTRSVSGFVGVNSITNASKFVNGSDQETDSALRKRFVSFLASLAKANIASISAAILSVQPGVTFSITEYFNFDGSAFPAGFSVVADDGTGNAQSTFLNAVSAAVDAVRAAGVRYTVNKPNDVTINVAVSISVATGGNLALAQANVVAALQLYVNTLGVGVTASFVDISNVIQSTAGVFSYSALQLNSSTSDVAITATHLAQLGSVTFS